MAQEPKISLDIQIPEINANTNFADELNRIHEELSGPTEKSDPVFISAFDILHKNDIEAHFLIDGLIPAGVIALLTGPSDLGKSILARQIAVNVALGREDVAGFPLHLRHNRAVYLTTEDGSADWKHKLAKYCLSPEDITLLQNLTLVFDYDRLNMADLEKHIQKEPFDIMIIDVFSDTMQDDLNSAQAVRRYFRPFKNLAEKYGCTFLFIHHLNKAGEKGTPSKLNVSGSGAIEQAVRCALELRAHPSDDDQRCLYVTKSNYVPASEKKNYYKLLLLPNLTFEFTGERGNIPTKLGGTDPKVTLKVLELYKNGLSTRAISETLIKEGTPLGKTRVNEIVRHHEKELINSGTVPNADTTKDLEEDLIVLTASINNEGC